MIWQERAKGGYPDRSFLALPGEQRMGAARRGLIPYSPMGYLTELGMTEGSRGHSTFSSRRPRGRRPPADLRKVKVIAMASWVNTECRPGQE
jgi:hypothetical protein